jgi:predicted ArsR family transcriptional regulator
MSLRGLTEKLDATESNVARHLKNLAEDKLIKKAGKDANHRQAVLWQRTDRSNGEKRVAKAAKKQAGKFVEVPLATPKKRKKRVTLNGEVHDSLNELRVIDSQIAELEKQRVTQLERLAEAVQAEL